MRLTRLRQQVRTPAERERRRISAGKLVYLALLAFLAAALLRLGFRKIWYVEGSGFLRARSALVQTVRPGRIVSSRVQVGRAVRRGEVLARIDPERPASGGPAPAEPQAGLRAELERLRARARDERRQEALRLEQAAQALEDRIADRTRRLTALRADRAARLQAARSRQAEQDRWRRLYELEVISLAEYLRRAPPEPGSPSADELERALVEEIAGLRERLLRLRNRTPRARAETLARIRALERALEQAPAPSPAPPAVYELRAPIHGVVAEVFRSEGEVLRQAEALARLVDPSSAYVEAWFPPSARARIAPGRGATVVFADGSTAPARVEAVDPALTPLPPEYQKRYEPVRRALRVRLRPLGIVARPGDLDAPVRVRIPRFDLRPGS